MNRLLFALILLFCSTTSFAQSPARIYSTFSDFFDDKYIEAELTLLWQHKTDETMHGGSAYTIRSETDSILTVDLKEYYPLVFINDTLFANCRYVEGSGFGEVVYMNDSYCFFIGPYTDRARYENGISGYPGITSSILLDVATEMIMDGNKHLYAINIKELYGDYVTKDFLKEMLGKDSDLYKAYKKERKKNSVDVVLKYVKKHFGEE